MSMDPEAPSSLRGLLTRVLCTVVGLLLFYVLSVGPACYLVIKKYDRERFMMMRRLDSFYFPLAWAVEGTPLRPPLTAYVEFWLALAEPPRVMP